jgi:hypothetical protein
VWLEALDRQRAGAAGRVERIRAGTGLLTLLLELGRPKARAGRRVWRLVGSGPGVALVLAAWSRALAACCRQDKHLVCRPGACLLQARRE